MADLAVRLFLVFSMVFNVVPLMGAPGDVLTTPITPMELPIEVEIELSPAGSLKQVGTWPELLSLLEDPYAPAERRPSFNPGPDGILGNADDVPLPALNTYPLGYNFLTGQPLRLRTSDGEVSWDQPGPLFDTSEVVTTDIFSSPTQLRSVVGHLVAVPQDPANPYQAAVIPQAWFDAVIPNVPPVGVSSLVVYNPGNNLQIPPDQTIVAVPAFFNGVLHELTFDAQDEWDGGFEELAELEAPVNEGHFLRDPEDTVGVDPALQPLIGRPAARILGKALFWDMQIGSDGVQACASCHFHAGVDNRTKNQLNVNLKGGDNDLEVFANRAVPPADPQNPNQDVVATDFPFHKLVDPDLPGEDLINTDGTQIAGNVAVESDDVMSSMGISIFKEFVDVLVGAGAFGPAIQGVAPLLPDIGNIVPDPVPVNQGLRRVEPRHTPTFHGAAFNLDNFWDARARFDFNGGSVFGPSDPFFHIFVNDGSSAGAMHGLPNPSEVTIELSLDQWAPDAGEDPVPARIKFSSLASQAAGPPLSEFEMSFLGRNWAKIGKKMLQDGVTPLANQLVTPTDSLLGPLANGGSKPGLSITYPELIKLAFDQQLWANTSQHFTGAVGADPFDFNFVLTGPSAGGAGATDTNQFTQMEANFSLFFCLSVQAYEEVTIPDDTPADRFFDVNPNAGHGVGEPGDQAVLFPTLIPDLVADGLINGVTGTINLVPDDPATPGYDGFGPDEVFGFDLFAGANLTAALAPGQSVGQSGIDRNPVHTINGANGSVNIRVGSNPFSRSAKCMLCHLGPEQTDNSINITHGVLKNDAEFEYPTPPAVVDAFQIFPINVGGPFDGQYTVPAPEPSGASKTVGGLILSEEVTEGPPQDSVEVEPRDFATLDDPATPWDDRIISQPSNFAFGDQGVYNIGLRPIVNDFGRGETDPFGWPLSRAALTLINIAGDGAGNPATPATAFQPNDEPSENNVMLNFDPLNIGATFEETGNGATFPGTTYTLQSINPGFERSPIIPLLPDYMVPWINDLPAGELHPQIDEMAGMVPNTLTPPNGGPGIEFPEIMFGADFHCGRYDPAVFGMGPPNFGWGPPNSNDPLCPQHQSGVAGNFAFPSQGTWPVPNRVLRDGAFKAPSLRNVELTGPYFHTGSYLTLRQTVDFYFRGGDFPVTNKESRDPTIVELNDHAFSFGTTKSIGNGLGIDEPIDLNVLVPGAYAPDGTYINFFMDGLPDTAFLYDEYPDSDHPVTPELTFPGATPAEQREAALEDAKNSIVKFLLALTDPRVKFERAPFDHPELFVPVDGTAPENTGGPAQLAADVRFLHLPAVGAAGIATPLPNFLGVLSTPEPDFPDHFDAVITASTAVEVIVDNLDIGTSWVGTWLPSGASGYWAADSVWANDASDSFTFNANLASGTAYAVYEWHTTWPSRYTAVPHEIRNGATLLTTVNVNQQSNGGQWNLLGAFIFNSPASVTVLATPGFSSNADAVRFVPLTTLLSLEITGPLTVDEGLVADYDAIAHFSGGMSVPVQPQLWDVDIAEASINTTGTLTAGMVAADTPAVISAQYSINGTIANDTHNLTVLNSGGVPVEVIIDNLDASTSSVGQWLPSGAGGFWATNSVWANDTGDSFTFTANLVAGVTYQVYEWHTVWPSRYTAVPHRIYSGATLLQTANVDQQVNGGQWNLLGTYTFNGPASVTILATPGFSSNADAVRFVPVTTPVEVIVDNLDVTTSSVGVWLPSSATGYWATNSVWANDTGDSFTFTANLAPGTYEVFEWHTTFVSRYSAVPHQIWDDATATLLATVNVDQQVLGSQWNSLGTHTFTGPASMTIQATSGFSNNADAVRFVPVP